MYYNYALNNILTKSHLKVKKSRPHFHFNRFWKIYFDMIRAPKREIYYYNLLKNAKSIFIFLKNTFGCRWLLMQTMYFRLTNFSWMFCEGYYLHRLLANTFEEQRSLVFMLVVGWGKYFDERKYCFK